MENYRAFISTQKRAAFRLITEKDIAGFAPVHYAAKYGHLQVCQITNKLSEKNELRAGTMYNLQRTLRRSNKVFQPFLFYFGLFHPLIFFVLFYIKPKVQSC